MEVLQPILENAGNLVVGAGFKVISAIVLWFVGRRLITFAMTLLTASLKRTTIETTLLVYVQSSLSVLLNIILVVAVLGFFGVETTSFAALLAAAGIAIGSAWSGLLAHFAAGVFLVLFRPFKVGDFVTAGGVTGTVQEVGLFVTTIDTMDNVRAIVANNAVFSSTIQNFSSNAYRRVELVAQLNHEVKPADAIELLKARLQEIPNMMTVPAPDVEILEFNLAGTLLAVRPYCHNEDYWQVYFDTNRVISETFGAAQYPVPSQHLTVYQAPA